MATTPSTSFAARVPPENAFFASLSNAQREQLAALGAQSASELLMQSPTVERQLSRML